MESIERERIQLEVERRVQAIREDAQVLMRYDLNGDGQIDEQEWSYIRAVVGAEVMTEIRRHELAEEVERAHEKALEQGKSGHGEFINFRYEVLRELGVGGASLTMLARDNQGGGRVALKVLELGEVLDEEALERFEEQGERLCEIGGPHLPNYLDVFVEEERGAVRCYLAQQYVEGVSLDLELSRHGRFRQREARELARQMLTVLQSLHAEDPPVFHRDIKPNNIIKQSDGEYVLIDFAALQAWTVRAAGVDSGVVGTAGYMPPEQIRGEYGAAGELYALGATLVHLLGGVHPADMQMTAMRLQYHDLVEVSAPFVAFLDALLEPQAADRPQSAAVALQMLQEIPELEAEEERQERRRAREEGYKLPQDPLLTRGRVTRVAGVALYDEQGEYLRMIPQHETITLVEAQVGRSEHGLPTILVEDGEGRRGVVRLASTSFVDYFHGRSDCVRFDIGGRPALDRAEREAVLDPEGGAELSGEVEAEFGAAIYGNALRYEPSLYIGRLESGQRVDIADPRLYRSQFNLPMVQLRVFLDEDSSEPHFVWAQLGSTSFASSADYDREIVRLKRLPSAHELPMEVGARPTLDVDAPKPVELREQAQGAGQGGSLSASQARSSQVELQRARRDSKPWWALVLAALVLGGSAVLFAQGMIVAAMAVGVTGFVLLMIGVVVVMAG